jgi:hypothetical protein
MRIQRDTFILTIISGMANAACICGFDPLVTKIAGVIGAGAAAGLLCLKQWGGPDPNKLQLPK